MSREDWTRLATFYEPEGRSAFVIASRGLAKHLYLADRWKEVGPAVIAQGRAISLDEFAHLRDKWAPDLGHALCQN
jgi:hypothetical protein